MKDVQIAAVAGRQFNRVSRQQLFELGLTRNMIDHRVAVGRLIVAERGVYAVAPLLVHDEWGRWMGATLTAPDSFLSHVSLAAAHGLWTLRRPLETVTRIGSGGPRRHGGVRVFRTAELADDERAEVRGIPATSVARMLVDLAGAISGRALARILRDSVRLQRISVAEIGDAFGRYRGRRGAGRLAGALARYEGLPLERARSGAEIRAMEILRDAGRPLPRLNVRIAGEEADLSWPEFRLVVEIDGRPFHQDIGEDARKHNAWVQDGWTVRRLDADEVYRSPDSLLALAPPRP